MTSWNRGSMINRPGYRLTPDARTDLVKIRRYTLSKWGELQSHKYLAQLRQVLNLLSESPNIGIQRPDLGEEAFSFPHSSHVVYYISNEEHMIVFGVLHKSMVPITHLQDRDTF